MTAPNEANPELEAALAAAAEAKAAAEAAERHVAELAAEAKTQAAADVAAPESGTATELSPVVAAVQAGYAFEGLALELGALVDGEPYPEARVRIPFGMLNRHGLVAGATGTGKTKTLQVLAEQVSAGGVPVFAVDIKGDLSGISVPGSESPALLDRCASIGQDWVATGQPTEFYTLGHRGTGVPIRASVDSFGSLLLSKVLGLNETQETSLALVFHHARQAELPLVTIGDLRAVITHLTSPEGKAELSALGGLSKATAGVILRELIAFADAGGDEFFGLPELDIRDLVRTAEDGRGIVSLLEVPGVAEQPALFSTFLMYLLRALFAELPEVGDTEKPKLVFFFDEAHLLFKDASKDFLDTVTQTVRLIRSKGVGVFFVTQTPKDVPSDVLAQLGSRIQHQLRAHTPQDAKALKATISTYPHSEYDLEEVLTNLATGEAIVTVMNEKGAPTPVAWTRLRAPQGSMSPAPAELIAATVAASTLSTKYQHDADSRGAAAILAERQATAESAAEAADTREDRLRSQGEAVRKRPKRKARKSNRMSPMERAIGEATRTATREIVKRLFGKR